MVGRSNRLAPTIFYLRMEAAKMLILLSNDDGIWAKGLKVLEKSLVRFGTCCVVAPDREKSAASHSVTLHRPLRVEKLGHSRFAVDGTPTDCVILGVHKLAGSKPNLLVSGINDGGNMADDVSYSGTVSAAVEGTILGITSIAVSLAGGVYRNFNVAGEVIKRMVPWVAKQRLPKDALLNVNVPDVERFEELKGIRWTRLGKLSYVDTLAEMKDPRGKTYYWVGGTPVREEENSAGTDLVAVEEGYVSITPIRLDLTHNKALKELRSKWEIRL